MSPTPFKKPKRPPWWEAAAISAVRATKVRAWRAQMRAGIITPPPFGASPEDIRYYYTKLRERAIVYNGRYIPVIPIRRADDEEDYIVKDNSKGSSKTSNSSLNSAYSTGRSSSSYSGNYTRESYSYTSTLSNKKNNEYQQASTGISTKLKLAIIIMSLYWAALYLGGIQGVINLSIALGIFLLLFIIALVIF